jgi:hypothetical protein
MREAEFRTWLSKRLWKAQTQQLAPSVTTATGRHHFGMRGRLASESAVGDMFGTTNLNAKIVPQPLDAVHALMQDRDDTYIVVAKELPVDVMPLIVADIAIHAEFRRNGAPGKSAGGYILETCEEATYIVSACTSPQVSRV